MLSELPTLALIGERYLDTQHDAAHVAQLEAELSRRGVVGARRAVLEYVSASALWWNTLWWEWVSLDGRAVVVGWISNLVLFGIVAAVTGYYSRSTILSLVAVLIAHAITVWIGFGLRQGTKEGSF
jgi:hypothetical protein